MSLDILCKVILLLMQKQYYVLLSAVSESVESQWANALVAK
jgi:hypothetical protein